jgi:hypothetical protein
MNAKQDPQNPRRPARARVAAVLAATLLIAIAGCNPPTATPMPTTGVAGRVTASPTCPVERPDQSPCLRPVPGAVIVAFDQAGREVARATSDAAGAYFLPLATGTYRVVPQQVEGIMGIAAERTVTVAPGSPARIDFDYDTGIR